MFGEAGSVFFARFDVTEHRADRIRFLDLGVDLGDLACARCRHAHHRFVGFDFDDFLIGGDFFARLHVDRDNRRLGDRFAELWHDDWNLGHGKFYVIPGASRGNPMKLPLRSRNGIPRLRSG